MKLIIPYRLKSSRFPNKYISNFLKKPLIEHSIKLCQGLGDVIVTAPKEDYVKEVSDLHFKYKFDFIATSLDCKTGTDRVMEISRNISDDYYVMIPADEPLILKEELKRVLYKEQLDDFNTCSADFYNKEDCLSTFKLREWLIDIKPEGTSWFIPDKEEIASSYPFSYQGANTNFS